MPRILVIDDEEPIRTALEQVLTTMGHSVVTAEDGHKAAKLFRAQPFDLILTDIVMPNREGLETIIELRREFPEVGVIAMSGGASLSEAYLGMAARLGAHHTLAKPFSQQQLQYAITETLTPKRS